MSVVIGYEQRIWTNRTYNQPGNRHPATARTHSDPVSIVNAQPARCLLVHLHPGIGCLLLEKGRTPRLVAREIMIDDAPGSQHQGIFLVRLLGRWNIGNGMEASFAIRETETLFIETRRAGTLFGWTGPEDAVLFIDLFVRNAPVV